MAIDALVKSLLNVALFQGLKPLQITEIARLADRIVFRPGEPIIHEHQMGDAAILIVDGEAVRVRGPELAMPAELVPAGSLLGEMAMLIETEHSSTIIARTPVRALRISRESIHAQMRQTLHSRIISWSASATASGCLRPSCSRQTVLSATSRSCRRARCRRHAPMPPRHAPPRPRPFTDTGSELDP